MGLTLYNHFRTSASYRVRIALNLKGLSYDYAALNLVKDGGDHRQAAYRALNPQGLVPALVLPTGDVLTQSLAIVEYLEETHPTPPLLPKDPVSRAAARAFALAIACDIHPLNNLRVLKYLENPLGQDEAARNAWYALWVKEGFMALEAMLERRGQSSAFCFGDGPGIAEIFLVPQMANARRFNCDITAYPRLVAADEAARALDAFAAAAPERQPDAV